VQEKKSYVSTEEKEQKGDMRTGREEKDAKRRKKLEW